MLTGVSVLVWLFFPLIELGGNGRRGARMLGMSTNLPARKILLLSCLTPELQVLLGFKQGFPWGWGGVAHPDPPNAKQERGRRGMLGKAEP